MGKKRATLEVKNPVSGSKPFIMKKYPNIIGLMIALALPLVAGGLGAVATNSSVTTWYPQLKKPVWNPPAWVFGPVWTTLYLLMGVASWLVWRERAQAEPQVENALKWYGVQLSFNSLWSIIFFGGRNIGLALVDIVILWSTLLTTFVKFLQIHRPAAWLLLPYLLWVSFASVLNAAVWWLNWKK